MNFESLLEEHQDLEEIWVCRIVDSKQIRKPENLDDGLANLCQLFAATVGEDDVKLFKYHVRSEKNQELEDAQSSKFACRGISISNGITATWRTGESWEEPQGNKQSRRIKNMQNLSRITAYIL